MCALEPFSEIQSQLLLIILDPPTLNLIVYN